ncbi:YceK/YidQ family lipoprotein [Leptospira noguchii]|uniref:YceK/YidQ family lipoprotein n=1 Tax=Leptospira noguchii TaxID=28182 RepID=A0A9Q8VX32_9LEPT|nr:YceK/YidQ family lipoprotein [Leptospira noguchii]TQE76082.1 YceK/YidQ family lipoprotein [Leptospira noguchii]UOG30410.1 YceK/YidQ family lipoprotein [Leptospira noguchii]UOG34113.1 YceK/YidQ family lipoprotein [Leptospira noguchii]UOG44976.1 YceK/YidQ family lipoprotein [Leptospira noguchii]UOG52539.1 YceK/YidQ family lipoprotein [Leptospira noguchii]
MIRKIIISLLIVLNLNCLTLANMKSANNDGSPDGAYFPYTGTLGNVGIILFGPFMPDYFKSNLVGQGKMDFLSFWLSRFIDLPLCLIADTVLLPGTLPYYIYVKSGRPWSGSWYHRKYEKRVTSFRDQNLPYNALKSIIASHDLEALQRFLKLYDVVALEKKIRYLQEEGLLPYEHSWTYDLYSHKIGIIDYIAALFSTQTTYRKIVPKTFNPEDRIEVVYTLYEEFRKDPILEKRYYDTVWKTCFSSGVLIENPKILKKVLQEFSEKKEISDLFESIAQRYSEKESKQIRDRYFNLDFKIAPQKISDLWNERVELLTEMDKFLQKNPELQKEWRHTAWVSAISSGVIAHHPQTLEKVFREFPTETAKSALNLFLNVDMSKNRQSVDMIVKNLKDADGFPLEQLTEETVIDILKYPNLVEKLLQTGWDPNHILKRKEWIYKVGNQKITVKEETSLLILSIQSVFVPAETFHILLKYGAKPNLGVKKYHYGKIEYELLYPMDAAQEVLNHINEATKRKVLMDWTESSLKEFHVKYPIYSVLQSYVEAENVYAVKKTLAGIDLISMEKEMLRLRKENLLSVRVSRFPGDKVRKISILENVSSLATAYFKSEGTRECLTGRHSEAFEIQKIFYDVIGKDKDLKRFFLENLRKNGTFGKDPFKEDPVFCETYDKI